MKWTMSEMMLVVVFYLFLIFLQTTKTKHMTSFMYSFPERNISVIFLWQTVVFKNMLHEGSLRSCMSCDQIKVYNCL